MTFRLSFSCCRSPWALTSLVRGRSRTSLSGFTLVVARMSTEQDSHRERRLFELVRDPLYVTSSDGRSHYSNAAGLELMGLSLEEFVAREWWDLIHADDRRA